MAALDLRGFSFLGLVVLCHLLLSIDCKEKLDLSVFKGNVNVTDLVRLNGTNDCLPSFDRGNLSSEVSGRFVSRPRELNVSVFDTMRKGHLISGVEVKWSSPSDEISRMLLKGFFVSIEGVDTPKEYPRCRLYLINHTAFDTDELHFSFSMKIFYLTKHNFIITVYSLPPPYTMNQPGTYQRATVTSKNVWKITYPGLWTPTIALKHSIDQGIGSIGASFTLPPIIEGWHLKEFTVMLLKCSESLRNYYKSETITKVANGTDKTAYWEFQGLNQDLYSVVVRVSNFEWPNTTLCVCQKNPDSCNPSCGSSKTAWFDLDGNGYPAPFKAAIGQESCLPSPTTAENITEPLIIDPQETTQQPDGETSQKPTPAGVISDDSQTSKVVIWVVVAVSSVIVLIAILLAAYFCCRRRKDKHNKKFTPTNALTRSNVSSIVIPHDGKGIGRKVIFLMSTADHPASVLVLDRFCDLLQKYCQCYVINPRQANLTHVCESAWLTATMSKSDCIAFVNFKGIETLVDAFLDNQTMAPDPSHSFILNGLQIAFNSSRRPNFISVIFTQDWIQDKLAILNPKKFLLPKQLTAFFAGVHNVPERDAKNYLSKDLPNAGRLDKLPEYQSLKEAVEELSKFENANKDFFNATYDNIKTTSSKSPASISSSISSGCSSTIHGAPSASLTDISPDADSPVSVFGEPTFSPEVPSSPDDGIGLEEGDLFSVGSAPGFYNTLDDGYSAVTVGQLSDTEYNDTQTCEHSFTPNPHPQLIPPCALNDIEGDDVSTALKRINEESLMSKLSCSISPKSTNQQPMQIIIPPHSDVVLSHEDSISTRLEAQNDNSSMWSHRVLNEEKDLDEEPVLLKPPHMSMPMDNVSHVLESLNDQNSEVCFRDVNTSSYEKDENYDSGLPEMSV